MKELPTHLCVQVVHSICYLFQLYSSEFDEVIAKIKMVRDLFDHSVHVQVCVCVHFRMLISLYINICVLLC